MNFSELFSVFIFLILLAIILLFDLGVFSGKSTAPNFKESLVRTGIWTALALLFCAFLWINGSFLHGIDNLGGIKKWDILYGNPKINRNGNFSIQIRQFNHELALSFLNGYLVEYSLSMDNILVIILIFTSFKVERKYYHTVLFWGILGAVALRALFIFLGTTLIQNFHWILYIFGGFLIFSGISMFIKRNEEGEIDRESHPIVKGLSKVFPIEEHFQGEKFFIRKEKKIWITPLFMVLLVIEFSDLIFAVDSIPAVFSITRDPYMVFFSNIFAIMGLRSLFFLMEEIVERFHYLKTGLAILLTLVGFKMVFPGFFEAIGFNNLVSLGVILGILMGSILLSLWVTGKRDSGSMQTE